MKAVYMTDQGMVRLNNEDSGGVFVNPDGYRLAIVADGMGGHRAGDVASTMTVGHLKSEWEKTSGMKTAGEVENWLKNEIEKVNLLLFEHAQNNSECEGMGTTIVATISTDGFATIAHIGDSRVYLLNESGFKQITEDHSLVNELVRSGQITKEDAENHPHKNVVLRALGTEREVEVDIRTVMFEDGDKLLLCSDGLSDRVKESEMLEILTNEDTLEKKAATLVSLANDYGGKDNITLVIVEFWEGIKGDS